MRKERTRIRDQQSNIGMSWQGANVRKGCVCDRTFWISTNVLLDAQVVLGLDNTEDCRARVEQEMVDKGDAIKLEASGNQEEIAQEPDASLQKRRIGDQISQAGRRA